ncbi:MAG TPA: DUF1634 domain-containing protein [Thermoanaerobaculia bacterium]|nr:DUF1634 domain-containing protein [Thermoanaerobaculia bacterium]
MKLDIENLISITLRTGVLVSIAVILSGVIFTFAHHPAYFSSRPALGELIDAREHFTSSITGVAQGVRALHGQAIVMLGILLLIATPIVRVAISTFLFAAEHDRRYVVITATVLVLLLISLMTGLGE